MAGGSWVVDDGVGPVNEGFEDVERQRDAEWINTGLEKKRKLFAVAFRMAELGVLVAAVFVWYWVFHNPVCNWLFRCGCTWNWEGGWDACNYHDPSALHKCPFCMSKPPITWFTSYFIMALQVLLFYVCLHLTTKILDAKKSRSVSGAKKVIARRFLWVDLSASHATMISHLILTSLLSLSVSLLSFFVLNILVGFLFWVFSDGYPHFIF